MLGRGFRHGMILLPGAATDTDRTDDLSIAIRRAAAGANHHAP
jgi:hypothetical protein